MSRGRTPREELRKADARSQDAYRDRHFLLQPKKAGALGAKPRAELQRKSTGFIGNENPVGCRFDAPGKGKAWSELMLLKCQRPAGPESHIPGPSAVVHASAEA